MDQGLLNCILFTNGEISTSNKSTVGLLVNIDVVGHIVDADIGYMIVLVNKTVTDRFCALAQCIVNHSE